jgi:hypothetical protein
MKVLAVLALFALSLSSFATAVKVTSFRYVRNAGDALHPLAELCGAVEGSSVPSFIKVLVDKAKNPATYNTVAGPDGVFCVAVITYRGTAEVSLFGENASIDAFIK